MPKIELVYWYLVMNARKIGAGGMAMIGHNEFSLGNRGGMDFDSWITARRMTEGS
jgi:hypothetical protein